MSCRFVLSISKHKMADPSIWAVKNCKTIVHRTQGNSYSTIGHLKPAFDVPVEFALSEKFSTYFVLEKRQDTGCQHERELLKLTRLIGPSLMIEVQQYHVFSFKVVANSATAAKLFKQLRVLQIGRDIKFLKSRPSSALGTAIIPFYCTCGISRVFLVLLFLNLVTVDFKVIILIKRTGVAVDHPRSMLYPHVQWQLELQICSLNLFGS